MSHAKNVLASQLLANANDPSWYVSFQQAVEGVSEEEANWKPNEECNSIAELVWHLLYWNKTWQARFEKGHVNAVPPIGDNDKSFVIPETYTFSVLKEELLDVLLGWQELLTEENSVSPVQGFPEPAYWWEILGNATTHNAYHIGQIVYVRKIQKSWHVEA
jgi:uncharacterized damage-inducible protein DinB